MYRFERKFIVDNPHFPLDIFIRTLKIPFKEVYHPRIINNVYFDTQELQAYKDNIVGKAERKKLRLRWYDEKNAEIYKPKLEYKIKKSLLGIKKTYSIMPVNHRDELLNKDAIYRNFRASELPLQVMDDLLGRIPVLINQYHRKYYASLDGKVRITVDSDISFRRFNFYANRGFIKAQVPVIVEVKYDQDDEEYGRQIGQMLPFRMTKFSKYQIGIEKTYTYYAH
ncbi:polyphosphate polymerase domain-containing protein [Catalinimonas niigatensis]|uniref:polyphosphate polymerase domain-containing protein n=1 Tax=Catalinimonas niigatensis TaxID=1397264 RepID=UPI00266704EE|nr:polyphosphate polymerase domain-containing protein [Catalinimonas niigatensis]WPP52370.1 polyphosphate polymerase domain-containing protein [Catalinimonas niigatensis]